MAGINWKDDGPQYSGKMQIGEQRTYTATDKKTGAIKTITVTRTDRPYEFDLADAYNKALPDSLKDKGIYWHVLPGGQLKLQTGAQRVHDDVERGKERAEAERLQFNHRRRYPMREAAE